ncbi:MAG: hypothetical protein EBQ80_04750 [Proteobacteria bacterium]|nr:hypothetical protein [Pseudomonadota bacterium]
MIWCMGYPEVLPLADGCVVAVGNFDGVHAGHQSLLAAALARAEALGLPLVVLTFEPHPRVVLQPAVPLRRLSELPEKVRLLSECGVRGVAVLPFNMEVAGWNATAFMQRILADWLGAKVVAVGENFRFGHRAAGKIEDLRGFGAFEVLVAPLVRDSGGVVSSSRLRGD